MKPLVYLDNNATTRVLPPVLDAMLPWLSEHYGNASSSHQVGQQAKAALLAARKSVASMLCASPTEITFTSGATESGHTAILGALAANSPRRRIVTSAVEHASTRRLLAHLARQGAEVVEIGVTSAGLPDLAELERATTMDTALVTLMHANNETGLIFPIGEAAAIAHARGALFHADAAQTVGKIPVAPRALGCDLLSFSGHKLHAPKGVGVLYTAKELSLTPMIHGHQERNLRGGTENQAAIVGLGVACRIAQERMSEDSHWISLLRDRLQRSLLARFPHAWVNGRAARVPNTCNLTFPGADGDRLLHRLDQAGIIVSRGSACNANGTEPSHVLLAMGLDPADALSSVRFSLSTETTTDEIDHAIAVTAQVLAEMSPAACLADEAQQSATMNP